MTGFKIKSLKPADSSEPVGDGVALTSTAHPPGFLDKMAEAIISGQLKLKRGRPFIIGPRPWHLQGISRRTYYRNMERERARRQKGSK